jgi:PAS domain S-box-containing protein
MQSSRLRLTWPRVYLSAVVSAGTVVIALSLRHLVSHPPGPGLLILAGLTIATGFATLRMPVVPISFSISDTFTITAALLFGPAAGALAVALDAMAISSRLARRDGFLRRALFNATAPALAMWLAATVFFWLAGVGPLIDEPGRILTLIGPLAVFAALYFVLNTGLIAGAVASEQHRGLIETWRRHFLGLWLTFFGGASIAALLMLFMESGRVDLSRFALVLPLIAVLYLMFKGVVGKMHDELQHLTSVNRMYQSLIHGAAYGIARLGVDGRFIEANPALAAMLGYGAPGDLLERNLWTDLSVHPSDRERLLTPPSLGEPISGLELSWRRRDGSEVLVRVSGRLVRVEKEEAPSFEMMVEDVTERRALEDQLRQSQKLEAIGRLAGGVAHDFNNILMSIMGSAELLLMQFPHDNPAGGEAAEIKQAVERGAGLTRQLLAFSRRQATRTQRFALGGVLQGMDTMLRRLIGPEIEFVIVAGPDPIDVVADRGQLEQVVMNLVLNARDAMPHGGRLTVRLDGVHLDGTQAMALVEGHVGDYARLSISDTGIGMDEQTRARLFEPFFTTKEQGKGTGLGLSIVYGIVKQSQGDISVSSTPREGTTFTIYLPAAAVAVASR